MSNKTTITTSVGQDTEFVFLVGTEEEQNLLASLGMTSGVINTPKGFDSWDRRQGHGGEALDDLMKSGHKIILLLKYTHMKNDKVQKLSKELHDYIYGETGHGLRLANTPAGLSIHDILQGLQIVYPDLNESVLASICADPHGFDALIPEEDQPTEYQALEFDNENDRDGSKRAFAYVLPQVKAVLGKDDLYYASGTDANGPLGKRFFPLTVDFFNIFASRYNDETGEILKANHRTELVAKLKGDADGKDMKADLRKQSYRDAQGNVWIDLGRRDCKVVKINADGWSVEEMPQTDAFGFLKVQELPVMELPQSVNGVENAWKILESNVRPFVCVSDADWALIVGWLINHFIGELRPFLQLRASDGVGKTTTSSALNYVLTGGPEVGVQGRIASDIRTISAVLAHNKINIFDNISRIDEETSELLCQADRSSVATSRALFTNAGLSKLLVDTSVILSGITIDGMGKDLKGRLLPVDLQRPSQRQSMETIKAYQVQHHPETFGALLTLISAALKGMTEAPSPTTHYDQDIRMEDYGKILWTLDALGLSSNAGQHYADSLREAAEEDQEDPLVQAIVRLVLKSYSFSDDLSEMTGEVGSDDLVALFNDIALSYRLMGEDLKLTPRMVPTRIKRGQSTWKKMGVHISDKGVRKVVEGRRQTYYSVTLKGLDAEFMDDMLQANAKKADALVS